MDGRRRHYRRWSLLSLVLLAGLAWAAVAAWQALPDAAREAFRPRPAFWILAFLVQTPGWLLAVDAWRRMLDATRPNDMAGSDGSPDALAALPFSEHLLGHGLTALAQVLPGSIWAPLTRVAYYRERGLGTLWTAGAMLLEMVLLGLSGLLLFLLALPAMSGQAPSALPALLAAGGAALCLLHPRVFGSLLRALARGLRISPIPAAPPGRLLARLLGQEFLVLALSACALLSIVQGLLPSAARWPNLAAAWGLGVAIASLLAWLPATALLKDGGMLALLTPLCLPAAGGRLWVAAGLALGLTLAWRLWTLVVLLVWTALAALWVRVRGHRRVGPVSLGREVGAKP